MYKAKSLKQAIEHLMNICALYQTVLCAYREHYTCVRCFLISISKKILVVSTEL